MTKRRLNGWTKWVIFAVTIVLIVVAWVWQASGIVSDVEVNTERIDKVEVKSHANEGDIRDLKKDVTYIREGIDEIKGKLP